MATEAQVKELSNVVKQLLPFQKKSLVARPEDWGKISFKSADNDLRRIFETLAYLDVLPLEYLTDTAISQIKAAVDQMSAGSQNQQ